jgi:hypothetical protein
LAGDVFVDDHVPAAAPDRDPFAAVLRVQDDELTEVTPSCARRGPRSAWNTLLEHILNRIPWF